ncbi:MAG: dual OB domain-containing protein [Caldimicrobium sp.]
MQNYKGIILTVAPSKGGECIVILDESKRLIRPIHPHEESFEKGTFEGMVLYEISFSGTPSPKPWHPEDVKVDMPSLNFHKKFSYQEVKDLLLPHLIKPEEFYDIFKGSRKVDPNEYEGSSIFLLPFSEKYLIEIDREWDREENREIKKAKINIMGMKIPITYWFEREFWNSLSVGDKLKLSKEDGFLIITLGVPYKEGDGYCYLLCSGILSPYQNREVFEFIKSF